MEWDGQGNSWVGSGSGPFNGRMTVREEAHRLLDAVPEDRLPNAVELPRRWAEVERGEHPRRRFRTTAVFDGEPDLAAL